jgi:hypothetical protein
VRVLPRCVACDRMTGWKSRRFSSILLLHCFIFDFMPLIRCMHHDVSPVLFYHTSDT